MLAATVRVFGLLILGLLVESLLPCSWPHPDLVLLSMVPLALHTNRHFGAWFGFCAGLSLGFVGAGSPGIFAGVYGLVGCVLGRLGEEKERSLSMQGVSMVLAVCATALMLVFVNWLYPESGGPSTSVLRSWIMPTLIWNLLLLWPAAFLFHFTVGARAFEVRRLEI